MAATAPKKRPERPRKRPRPRRAYVIVDYATEDAEAGAAAVEAWLAETEKR